MNKKRMITILVIAGILMWAVRYTMLNDGFKVGVRNPVVQYQIGDTVDFEDDKSGGAVLYKNLHVTVDDCHLYDTNDYLQKIHKDRSDFQLLLGDKIVELTVTIDNQNPDFVEKSDGAYSPDDAVNFNSFELTGPDWYVFPHRELMAYANPVFQDNTDASTSLVFLPDEKYQMKWVFCLSQGRMSDRRWKQIANEDMALILTFTPIEKRVAIKCTSN